MKKKVKSKEKQKIKKEEKKKEQEKANEAIIEENKKKNDGRCAAISKGGKSVKWCQLVRNCANLCKLVSSGDKW
jgi:hypothetical protein